MRLNAIYTSARLYLLPPSADTWLNAAAIQLDKGLVHVAINPLKDLPGYLLRRASAWTMAELSTRLEKIELTPTEASVLVVISSNPGIIQREIGQMLGIVSANMTPLVSRLEDRDLIKRLPVDKRSFGLRTTRRGAIVAERAYAAMQAQEEALIGSVAPKNRTAFLQTLQDIASAHDE